MFIRRSLPIMIMFLLLLSYMPAETKFLSRDFQIEIINEKPQRLPVKAQPFEINYNSHTKSDPSYSNIHPALADNGAGYMLVGYESFINGPFATLYWVGSGDDGASWGTYCWIDLFGSTYPSADYWGIGTMNYATFVPPGNYQNGAAFMLMKFPDPTDCSSWSGVWSSYASQGWYGMKMNEIATNSGKQSWNWGFISAVLSRIYPPDTVWNLYDAPHIFYQIDAVGHTMIDFYQSIDSCLTTSCDIDPINFRTYAVYDHKRAEGNQKAIFIRQDYFADWDSAGVAMDIYFEDSGQHQIYPVVAAHDGNIIVVAATYHVSMPDDKDIICRYTGDGNVLNLTNMSIIASSPESENFPEISHVSGDTFVCTFVKNNILYASRTDDGGIHWSTPEPISENNHIVAEEYRTADIGDGGHKVIYEYSLNRDTVKQLAIINLDTMDYDGDGIYFYEDNCPLIANPSQLNNDSDIFGDACDNCPSDNNPYQEDTDLDGIGDSCDICPDDPLDDVDGDDICGSTDNCPEVYNPGQEDDDSDGVGDDCDNCISVANSDQSDADEDGAGDACDECTDTDGDGYGNPGYPNNICDEDNCPPVYNPDQTDSNFDGVGDACDYMCGDPDGNEIINLLDITHLIAFLYKGGPPPYPVEEAGDVNNSGDVNLLDITYLINYLYKGGPPPDCS